MLFIKFSYATQPLHPPQPPNLTPASSHPSYFPRNSTPTTPTLTLPELLDWLGDVDV